ncbi:hypothetical protein EYF80_049751 [Liparis tanakae]|uniref:Uncharacterized protein n=1 Tax=Liparis tanakae TaxID=230148 RepID=A0A4Z2FFW5_9TELE|nr:hypothetical protein EYF80_049751 [Liparis tanakae]
MVAPLPPVEILLVQILVGQGQSPQALPCKLLYVHNDVQEFVAALPSHFHDGHAVWRARAEDEAKVSGRRHQRALIRRLGHVEELPWEDQRGIQDQKVRKAEKAASLPSCRGRKAVKLEPSFSSQKQFPIARTVHMKARKPKI